LRLTPRPGNPLPVYSAATKWKGKESPKKYRAVVVTNPLGLGGKQQQARRRFTKTQVPLKNQAKKAQGSPTLSGNSTRPHGTKIKAAHTGKGTKKYPVTLNVVPAGDEGPALQQRTPAQLHPGKKATT